MKWRAVNKNIQCQPLALISRHEHLHTQLQTHVLTYMAKYTNIRINYKSV